MKKLAIATAILTLVGSQAAFAGGNASPCQKNKNKCGHNTSVKLVKNVTIKKTVTKTKTITKKIVKVKKVQPRRHVKKIVKHAPRRHSHKPQVKVVKARHKPAPRHVHKPVAKRVVYAPAPRRAKPHYHKHNSAADYGRGSRVVVHKSGPACYLNH